ncbi:hypothetical protein SMY46_000853 [Cronobacter turicensis]|uniref:hypothetical protein n=1 Tax=Cronobacter turicensis TaxID=413502 RepID=UPI0011AC965B|nr:hypothetical protein [Cronobacter turicensis]EKY3117424.1 hypothetical protein [Cronobacter turicensis]ELU8452584.1 hypothetical protein [Cronobacter turicensis]ELY4109223.1 hypothetical protein [Cronobacter turicensis]ELY4215519.1 hypothetical protein [Cronobacter turicensis]EMA1789504.1 hypothetical protein [Cronobacter turicensis]
MFRAGFVTEKALAEWQDIPSLLPVFQFHEKHSAVIRTSYPNKILPCIAAFDMHQDPVIRALMSVRQLPQRCRSNSSGKAESDFGLHSFTPLHRSASELCFGLRGQFWRADFGLETVPDVAAYEMPVKAGSAKLLLRYRVRPLAERAHELSTETFIYCPDGPTRRKMALYWLAIRAGSGLIRQRTLKSVQLKLERESNH